MTKKTRSRRIAIIFVILFVGALLALYEYFLPEQSARAYERNLHAAARQTKKAFQKLAATYDNLDALITGPSPKTIRQADIASIQQAMTNAEVAIASLRAANTELQGYPYSGYLGAYRVARVTQQHTTDFIHRSDSVLEKYNTLVAQTDRYVDILQSAQSLFDTFNSVTDINTYAGQSDLLTSYASQLQQRAAELSSLTLPGAFDAPRDASTRALTAGAQGFSDLATALAPPIDEYIYAAVHTIEAANTALDTANQSAPNTQLATSRTIKDLDDLVETVDYLVD